MDEDVIQTTSYYLSEIADNLTTMFDQIHGMNQINRLLEKNISGGGNTLVKCMLHYQQIYLPYYLSDDHARMIVNKCGNIFVQMSYSITEEMYQRYFDGFIEFEAEHINRMAEALKNDPKSEYQHVLMTALCLSITTLSNILCIDGNSKSVRTVVCKK